MSVRSIWCLPLLKVRYILLPGRLAQSNIILASLGTFK